LLFYEFPDQVVEVGNLLISSRISVVYDQMDPRRVPQPLNPHLLEDPYRQRTRAVLGHGQVCRQNRNVAGVTRLVGAVSAQAYDFLSKSERIIVQYGLPQMVRDSPKNQAAIKLET
jgi:hypothetical protein